MTLSHVRERFGEAQSGEASLIEMMKNILPRFEAQEGMLYAFPERLRDLKVS